MASTDLLLLLFFVIHLVQGSLALDDAEDRRLTLTLINNCGNGTTYPGIQGNAGHKPLAGGGFQMKPGNVTVLQVPAGWSGLIWPRMDCDFSRRPSCIVGDCGPQAECMGAGPQKPFMFAKLSVDADAGAVTYEVSTENGFEMPMTLEAIPGRAGEACPAAGCNVDIMCLCPENQLYYWLPVEEGGFAVACMSLCKDGTGPCELMDRVKRQCPNWIAYKGDKSRDSLTCGLPAELRLTFCPTEVDVVASM